MQKFARAQSILNEHAHMKLGGQDAIEAYCKFPIVNFLFEIDSDSLANSS